MPGFLLSEHRGQKVQPASTRLFAQISRNPAGFHIINDREGQGVTSGLRPSTLNLSPPVGTLCGDWAAVCPPAKCYSAKSDQVNRAGEKKSFKHYFCASSTKKSKSSPVGTLNLTIFFFLGVRPFTGSYSQSSVSVEPPNIPQATASHFRPPLAPSRTSQSGLSWLFVSQNIHQLTAALTGSPP